jgi:carboxymethylenebutenolidase
MTVQTPAGPVPVALAVPRGDGPWPGVVVIHDAVGMTSDLVNQTRWLAEAGFVAAAPDLLRGGTIGRCLRDVVRDYSRWEGTVFDQIEAVRLWLAARDDCTGRVGVIGFCLGGGFALALAPRGGFAAASANYGRLPATAERFFAGACPIVASYGRRDRSLRGAAGTLRRTLDAAGVVHDVQEYPDAGHGFLNDHAPGEVPIIFQALGAALPTRYHDPSARDARRRIEAFFTEHLADGGSPS